MIEHDREVLPDVRGRVVGEELGALFLELEGHHPAGCLVRGDRGRRQLGPAEQGRKLLLVDRVALVLLGRAERDELEQARLAHEAADRVRIGNAGQLDDDPVAALDGDHRLRDTRRVDPVLDDRPDDFEVLGPGRLALDRERLVLDAQSALQVEPDLRLEDAIGLPRHGQARNEIDDEGEDPDDENQDRTGLAHQRRMIQERHSPTADPSTPTVSRRTLLRAASHCPGGSVPWDPDQGRARPVGQAVALPGSDERGGSVGGGRSRA